jgi:hypothetical protein
VPIPSDALPHLARVVQTKRVGERNAQGEREALADLDGPWFPARRMTPRPSKGEREDGGRRRSEVRWVLLYGDEYDDGSELTRPPREYDLVDVDREGDITRYVVGPKPRELDTGDEILGGQVELVEVGDSA